MKKFFIYMIIIFFVGAGFSVYKLWVKSPESFRILIGCPTESPFRDNSVLVEYVPPGKPKVTVFTLSREKLMSQARIRRMRARRAAAKEFVETQQGLSRPTAVSLNLTNFAGSEDRGVGSNETGSVSGVLLRSVDVKSVRGMAWFMPGFSDKNHNSPIKVPCVETWLGGEGKTLAQRIANANKELKNYFVELSVLDRKGHLISGPLLVEIHDRGPSTAFEKPRADGFYKTWADLGVLDATYHPNSDNHKVNLVVRLVPKTQISDLGGENIQLPNWASNP